MFWSGMVYHNKGKLPQLTFLLIQLCISAHVFKHSYKILSFLYSHYIFALAVEQIVQPSKNGCEIKKCNVSTTFCYFVRYSSSSKSNTLHCQCLIWSYLFFVQATPMLGAVCVLLCVFVVHEPKRGAIEKGENPNAVSASNVHNTSSWLTDLKYITTVWVLVYFHDSQCVPHLYICLSSLLDTSHWQQAARRDSCICRLCI